MPRKLLWIAVGQGVLGTGILFYIKEILWIAGWWIGVAAGVINYLFLLSNIRVVEQGAQSEAQRDKTKILKIFLFRYGVIGCIFFLTFLLGREQIGSCLVAFILFYVTLMLEYLIRLRKQKS